VIAFKPPLPYTQVVPEMQQRLRRAGRMPVAVKAAATTPTAAARTGALTSTPKQQQLQQQANSVGKGKQQRGSCSSAGDTKHKPAVPAASTLRQMAPFDAVKQSQALQRRIDRAQVGLFLCLWWWRG